MRKPIVGETLFLVDAGNRTRRNQQRDCVVSKVGRKYFYVTFDSKWKEVQFVIESWCENTDYMSNYALHESRQDWEEYILFLKYYRSIRDFFQQMPKFSGARLSELKQIIHILKIKD